MNKATEIFEKHWFNTTSKPLDETTKHHMQYAIEAVHEALVLGGLESCNKEQALEYMRQGMRIRFKHFLPDEWMTIKNGMILLEDGVVCSISEFFKYRTSESWNDGYFVIEQ